MGSEKGAAATRAKTEVPGYVGLLVCMLILWLGAVAWHDWNGINPMHAAVGMGIIVLMSGPTCLLISALQGRHDPLPLVLGVMMSNTYDSMRGRSLASVAWHSAGFGTLMFGSFSLVHLALFLARRSARAKESHVVGPMWDADADRPLAAKEPL